MSILEVGKKAPMFTLNDQNGDQVSLSDFLGKFVVVYFYPKAMTPGCTTQACGIRDSLKDLSEANTVVLGISPDPVNKLKQFEEKEKLNFRLLSDPGSVVARAYNSFGQKKFMGREYEGVLRQSYIVGKKGILLSILNNVKTKTHHKDVLEMIKTLY